MRKKRRGFLTAAVLALTCVFGMTAFAAGEGEPAINVNSKNGTVEKDAAFDGPQITKIRVLNEGNFLEIYWDRYVDESEAVNVSNFVLKNGNEEIQLEAKGEGYTNTLYFDQKNKEVAATDANSMARLSKDLHMSSISYTGNIGTISDEGLTLEVKGDAIKDENGKRAKTAVYKGIPKVNFYTQYLTSKTGIVIKADDTVAYSSLEAAAAQVDVELGKTETGIAANMAKYGCSLAVYSPHENVYLIPEHRGGFRNDMYDVEGYGGSLYNNCVSSIAERNILRTRDNTEDPDLNTAYRNENILIHEFGHCVKSVGLEYLEDQTLADEFFEAYANAKESGLWPNTYSISNSDEFFATMCTVWFNVMQESDSWDDGVRCPINTREELKKYDPVTYNFFAKILPDETLPAPWDEAAPDEYHTEYVDANAGTKRTESVENNFETDYFKLQTVSRGSEYQVDRYAPDETRPAEDLCLWFPWGTDGTDDNGAAWRLAKTEEGYYRFISPDGWSSVTATSESTVSVTGHMPDEEDTAQQWKFVENPSTALVYDGKMVNVKYGTEMVYSKPATSGSTLSLAEAGKGDNWLIRNTNQTLALGISAYLAPEKAEPENPENPDNPDNSDNPAKPENPEKPGVEDNQKPSVKPADQTKPEAANAQSNTVKTGDTANVVLPIVMIVAAIAVVVGIAIYKKKR